MDKALEMNIKGIKCDSCDYKNMDVKLEDHDQWVNKPCPNCGENLLTEADYNNVKQLLNFANIINGIFPPPKEDEKLYKTSVEMNGTGSMNFKFEE